MAAMRFGTAGLPAIVLMRLQDRRVARSRSRQRSGQASTHRQAAGCVELYANAVKAKSCEANATSQCNSITHHQHREFKAEQNPQNCPSPLQ